jgi:hypothetical protein
MGFITITTTECNHETYTIRKVTLNLRIFKFTRLYKVCHTCHKLIEEGKWAIELN